MDNIDQVHPQLYIADIDAVRTEPLPNDVDVVMTVCQDSTNDHAPEGVGYRFFNMSDGPDNEYGGRCDYPFFEEAVDCLLGLLVQDRTVLIHCHAGQSRSASVAIAALAEYENSTYRDMYRDVDESRPQIVPDRLLEQHAQNYLGEDPDGLAHRMEERAAEGNGEP